jgi:hypothetical protein|nr:MAG TPA: hypothetical protein [Caudoviricetes sp.]
MSCNVNLYKNETSINDTEANLYMQLNSNSRTSLQYDSDHWTGTVNTTVQSKFSTITIYAENKNGAHLTSMTIPVSSSGDKSIRLYDGKGRPYIDISGHDVAGNDFVTLTNSYNNKGLHLKRINNASSDDILYILDGLPTSDPKIEGVLWMDSDRTLKVSSRGFGHENN